MEPSISDVGAMSSLCVFRHHVSSIVIDAMKAPHFEISTQALRNYSSYDIKLAVDLHTPSQGNFIHSGHLRFAVKVEILQPFQGLWTTTLKYMQQILHITLKKKWADRSCQYLWMFFQKRWCVFFQLWYRAGGEKVVTTITESNFRHMYWTPRQHLATRWR